MTDNIRPFDLKRMFIGDIPPLFLLEIAFRTFFIYLFALLLIRVIGKRGLQQMTPFEYLVIIALGSATGDPMFYPQIPLLHSMMVILIVVLLEQGLAISARKSSRIKQITESSPTLMIEEGNLIEKNLKKEQMDKRDVFMKLREKGVEYLSEVKYAYLESSGKMSVYRYKRSKPKRNSILPDNNNE